MSQKFTLIIGTICGGLGVFLGAFGAHFLRAQLVANQRLDAFETAVRYQFYHALALLFAGALMNQIQNRYMRYAAFCWMCGIFLFSGSLYAISFSAPRGIALLTPVGGTFFIAGWFLLLWAVVKNK